MYIFSNAFKNLGRNKGRNILLGIVMLSLILATTVALVINTTTRGIIEDYKGRFGSKVTIKVDFDRLTADKGSNGNGTMAYPTPPKITPKQYVAFSESDYLRSYTMMISNNVGLQENLLAVGDTQDGMVYMDENENQVVMRIKLISCSDTDNLPDFADGFRKIVDGGMFQGMNECLVSSDFAELNDLHVGDTFFAIDGIKASGIPLKISGIYADITPATQDLANNAFTIADPCKNRRNEVFVSLDTALEQFSVHNFSVMQIQAEYELKSPELLDGFEAEVREKGLPEVYNVGTDIEGYNRIVAPVEGLSKISMTFMLVILTVGGIILLFITTMAIRERKYEIGVLRAMGMKKAKVAIMLIAEMVMITAVCLCAGLGIGNMLSQPVADTLIASQVEASEPIGDMENSSALTEIHVALSPEAIGQISAVALMLALLSSTAGVAFITRYEPMKILSERN